MICLKNSLAPFFIPNEQDMLRLGICLAKAILATPNYSNPTLIFLCGQLGAGKTTLVRGFLQGLGYQQRVKSPTYTLVETYDIDNQIIYHFDFYRIQHANELNFIGLTDYLQDKAISLIEWPEQAAGILPTPDLIFSIKMQEQGRQIKIEAMSHRGQEIVECLDYASQNQ
jgi:tRNA threonylcarbamoyladenosine biosynthesis protein TsaE